jgi:NAD(P) transhydrogenase subunit alpha
MYAKNVTTFLLHLVTDGKLELDRDDEITAGTLITHGGEIVNGQVLEAMAESTEGGESE